MPYHVRARRCHANLRLHYYNGHRRELLTTAGAVDKQPWISQFHLHNRLHLVFLHRLQQTSARALPALSPTHPSVVVRSTLYLHELGYCRDRCRTVVILAAASW